MIQDDNISQASEQSTSSRVPLTTPQPKKRDKICSIAAKMGKGLIESMGWLEYLVLFLCCFMLMRILFYNDDSSPVVLSCPFPQRVCNTFNKDLSYNKTCRARLVESIPENLTFDSNFKLQSTYEAWSDLILKANSTIDLAVFYWSLNGSDVPSDSGEYSSAWQGEDILKKLIDAGANRNISLRIVQNAPNEYMKQNDANVLIEKANAEVESINFTSLIGAGVLHTKMWIVDDLHVYIGSANMDWRSLTQVKELGIVLEDCPAAAKDATKIFDLYRYASQFKYVPRRWPIIFSADSNINFPLSLSQNGSKFSAFFSSSPPQLNSKWRANDIDAIKYNILSAKKFVYVAVMDYYPLFLYTQEKKYYPVFDEALREAAYENNVNVRVLASHWNHTRADMAHWLNSLRMISQGNVSVEVKLFVVPSYTDEQAKIPFGRVNHNKYMVTDITAYIDTSNWSGDYFTNTGGVGISITPINGTDATLRDDLQAVFERDWNSPYAHDIDEFLVDAN